MRRHTSFARVGLTISSIAYPHNYQYNILLIIFHKFKNEHYGLVPRVIDTFKNCFYTITI